MAMKQPSDFRMSAKLLELYAFLGFRHRNRSSLLRGILFQLGEDRCLCCPEFRSMIAALSLSIAPAVHISISGGTPQCDLSPLPVTFVRQKIRFPQGCGAGSTLR